MFTYIYILVILIFVEKDEQFYALHISVEQLQKDEHYLRAHQVLKPDFSINKSLWTYFIGTGNTSLDTIRLQSRKK